MSTNPVMDEIEARAQRALNRLRDLGDEMAKVRGQETSEDGAVTVEVDGNGTLRDLRFTSAVSRMSPSEFEQAVVSTAHRAAAQAMGRMGELITDFNEESAAQA
ncbi:YbaB/EbfC family nucleoid-associated protein [Nocardia sp. NPDC051832]|uniref:YbaB/EbfC family nucleoid-associated protein n=1 Tax=Nocardia sp. NPDC051832 TaxID=3155673 RepID=UPI00344934D4